MSVATGNAVSDRNRRRSLGDSTDRFLPIWKHTAIVASDEAGRRVFLVEAASSARQGTQSGVGLQICLGRPRHRIMGVQSQTGKFKRLPSRLSLCCCTHKSCAQRNSRRTCERPLCTCTWSRSRVGAFAVRIPADHVIMLGLGQHHPHHLIIKLL